ncbi:Prophage integrase IntS [Klebsiella spallanzanii]|nr:Prophage integrase IntS [Klebsiella spallanzanii]
MTLSDAKIRSIKPLDKPFKLTDSHGLYLLVNLGGSRLWYLKYRFNRKESRIARAICRNFSCPTRRICTFCASASRFISCASIPIHALFS